MVNKDTHFADFVKFRPQTDKRTQQSLPPLWAALIVVFIQVLRDLNCTLVLRISHEGQ